MSRRGRKPGAYVGMPFTEGDDGIEKQAQDLSVLVAGICRDVGLETYVAWAHMYPNESPERPTGETFEGERHELLEAEVFVFLDLAASTGAGRMLQVAADNLIDVIFLFPKGRNRSRVARGHPRAGLTHEIEFTNESQLGKRLRTKLLELMPRLRYRHGRWPSRNIPPACASRIAAARNSLGMNQATLAEGLGVDVKYVAAVERGDVVPSLYVTRVLTQALDMRPGTLQVPVAVAGDKADEEGAIASYWLRNNLPTGDFVEFVESLENRTGDVQGRINDDEIALLYAIWLQKKQAT